jgi:glutamate/tyrosine decarboxylase-like PLP-dependent enzyme
MRALRRFDTPDALRAHLEALRAHDYPYAGGRAFGYAFDPGGEAQALAEHAYLRFLGANGLDPTAFPSLRALENEVVGALLDHCAAPPGAVGTFTSGGTESILLAAKAAREAARARRRAAGADPRDRLRVVLPVTAHAAFHKAAAYLDLDVALVPIDPRTFEARVDAMREALDDRAALVVASAPSLAHGVVDPIPAIAAECAARGLWLHVDACVGGVLLPYVRRWRAEAGLPPLPGHDFSVPGVTSMSVDLHKYALCPKGASVVLFRDAAARAGSVFACAEWTGYSLVNTGVPSTKSGGSLAAAWSTLTWIGDDGYRAIARALMDATARLRAAIDAHPDLRVLGDPALSVLSFTSDTVDVFHLHDELRERGYHLRVQFRRAGCPASLHLYVAPVNLPRVDGLLAALAEAVEAARPLGRSPVADALGAALGAMRPEDVSDEAIAGLMGSVGVTADALPSRAAELNQILDALPPAILEKVVTAYVSAVFGSGLGRVPQADTGGSQSPT